jgi:hypothetical protein
MKTQDPTYIPFNPHAETIYRSVLYHPQRRNPDALSVLYIARKFANIRLACETDDSETDWSRYYTLDEIGACDPACFAYAACSTVEQLVTILRSRPDWLAWCSHRADSLPKDLKEAIDYVHTV